MDNNSKLQKTSFLNGNNKPIKVSNETLNAAKDILKTPPLKRGRNDDDGNEEAESTTATTTSTSTRQIHNNNKSNKFDNKTSTGFKTGSNEPVRVSKDIFNTKKQEIDIELQQDIDLNNYQGDIMLLEQPFKNESK